MLSVRRLYVLEEPRDVGIVTETDECLGIVPGDADVVALVLASELSVMLTIEG